MNDQKGGTPAQARAGAMWYVVWVGAALMAFLGLAHAQFVGLGYDSHAYWAAVQHMEHLYRALALSRDAYLYSPLFAQVIWPLGHLPWPIFGTLWSLAVLVAFVWLLWPLRARWLAPALVAVLPEVVTGNIYAFMAVAVVAGVRRGSPWALLGLTKVIPGVPGVMWHIGVRQWKALAGGSVVTLAMVAFSWLLGPDEWMDWLGFLRGGGAGPSEGEPSVGSPVLTVVLLGVGLTLAWVAARTSRPWLLAVSVILMSPTIGVNTLTVLAAVPRLLSAPGVLRAPTNDR